MQQYLKINIGTFPLDTLKENFTGGFKNKATTYTGAGSHARSISAEWTAASKYSKLLEEYAETNTTKKEEEEHN